MSKINKRIVIQPHDYLYLPWYVRCLPWSSVNQLFFLLPPQLCINCSYESLSRFAHVLTGNQVQLPLSKFAVWTQFVGFVDVQYNSAWDWNASFRWGCLYQCYNAHAKQMNREMRFHCKSQNRLTFRHACAHRSFLVIHSFSRYFNHTFWSAHPSCIIAQFSSNSLGVAEWSNVHSASQMSFRVSAWSSLHLMCRKTT